MTLVCDMHQPPRKQGFIVQVTDSHIEDLVQLCNMLSINLLKIDQFDDALWLLHKSKDLTEYSQNGTNSKSLAMSHNNLACYYKKRG